MINVEIKIDEAGRVLIPKKIRNNLNIKKFDRLQLLVQDEEIILKKKDQNEELEKLINKIDYLVKRFNVSYLVIDKKAIIKTSKDYKGYNMTKVSKLPVLKSNIVTSTRTKLRDDLEIIKTHYYFASKKDSYDKIMVIVIINDENFKDEVLSHLKVII